MASSISRRRPPAALALAAVVFRHGPSRRPGTARAAGLRSTAGGVRPGDRLQRRRPSNCSRRGSGRCSPPTATPATASRRWAACASTRARGCCRAARPARPSCPAIPRRARCSRCCSTPTGSRACRAAAPSCRPADIDALAEWIRAGAVWPARRPPTRPAPARRAHEGHHAGAARVLVVPAARASRRRPPCSNAAWPKTDIDRFILARLEREGLAPVGGRRQADADPPRDARSDRPAADARGGRRVSRRTRRRTRSTRSSIGCSRRRATARPGAACGSTSRATARTTTAASIRWAAATPRIPNAYLYRDWVIKAFNDDLPYDQFVKAQLAADLLDEPTRVRHLPALGFLGLGPWYYDNGAVEITRADERHDRVDVVTRGFLGLTVGCARCHDHKYDPIPTKDYYSLAGVFLNTEYHEYPLAPKSVVDELQGAGEEDQAEAEAARPSSSTIESRQLAETLAFQASKYMQAAWKVTGEPKKDKLAGRRRTRSSTTSCSIAGCTSSRSRPMFYPFLKDWQEMVEARRHGEGSRRSWPTSSRTLLLEVMFEQREVKKENDIIRAQGAAGHARRRSRRTCRTSSSPTTTSVPAAGSSSRACRPSGRSSGPTCSARPRRRRSRPAQPETKPGLLRFRGWGLEQRLGGDRRALHRGAAQRHRGDARRRCRRSTPTCTACATSRSRPI